MSLAREQLEQLVDERVPVRGDPRVLVESRAGGARRGKVCHVAPPAP
jgi:hypothetical protein